MTACLACMALSLPAQQVPPAQTRGIPTDDSKAPAPQQFQGRIFSDEGILPLGRPHAWYLYVEDAGGHPLEDAQIEAEGVNSDIGLRLPSPPRASTYVGNGHYLIEGVLFPASGRWVLQFRVLWQGRAEQLRFTVLVPPRP